MTTKKGMTSKKKPAIKAEVRVSDLPRRTKELAEEQARKVKGGIMADAGTQWMRPEDHRCD